MTITLDTNVFGPVAAPDDYPKEQVTSEIRSIKAAIEKSLVHASISEASLTLEALERHVRIDKFYREWAAKSRGIVLPTPSEVRARVFQNAFRMGITVLRVPRIALGSFVKVPQANWEPDTKYAHEERRERTSKIIRDNQAKGLHQLKEVGAELVKIHGIDTSTVYRFPGWPSPEELLWMKGLVAEFDDPKKYRDAEVFSRTVRDIIAEWTDVDILASHYGYGIEYLCTRDVGSNSGINSLFHTANRTKIEEKYGVRIVSPEELAKLL